MEHRIIVSYEKRRLRDVPLTLHIRRCIRTALAAEGVSVPCEINVLVTDDEGIRVINRIQRSVDKPTDVLSFPMFPLTPGQIPEDWTPYRDEATGLVPLGDMAISMERVKAQASEYGHGIKRELGYLTVHSVLHLLGYDHMDEGPMKKQMRAEEERILAEILLPRQESV